MDERRSFAARCLNVIGPGLLALAITVLAGGIWSALLITNLRISPVMPWSVPVMALLLWLMWSYLGLTLDYRGFGESGGERLDSRVLRLPSVSTVTLIGINERFGNCDKTTFLR